MSTREAVQILMLSPLYFRLTPPQRKILVEEFSRVEDRVYIHEGDAHCTDSVKNENVYFITKLSAVG